MSYTSKKDLETELNEAWAYALILSNKLKAIKEFANNEHATQFQSTIDYPGGYAQALRDLKQLLGE